MNGLAAAHVPDIALRELTGLFYMLGIRCVVTSARHAMNHEIVDLAVLGMEQNGVTSRAGVIDSVRTRDQNGRGAYDRTAYRSLNRLQTDFQML